MTTFFTVGNGFSAETCSYADKQLISRLNTALALTSSASASLIWALRDGGYC